MKPIECATGVGPFSVPAEECPTARCFSPIASPDARLLILGSMPGPVALNAGQYYAHPRNAFWRIMGELLDFSQGLDYQARVAQLRLAGVAVWDVLYSCRRQGALDTAIDDEVANDLAEFLVTHTAIGHVFFNGAKAESCFRRHVRRHVTLALPERRIAFARLPSTSPAHARLSFEGKLDAWRAVTRALAG